MSYRERKHARSKTASKVPALNKRQKKTILDNQHKRVQQLRDADAISATVICHLGYNVVVQTAPDTPLMVCDWRQHVGAICAGDQVLVSEQDAQIEAAQQDTDAGETARQYRIEAILPRANVIEKHNAYRGNKPFAANIDQLLIVVTHEPMLQASLLDRYLITAQHIGVDALIYFNKTDLLTDAKIAQHIERLQAVYDALPNVRWLRGSLATAEGLTALKAQLAQRKTVITGQSGVGKSTLINALIPDIDVQTLSISEASGLGRHSTTHSTLYRLPTDDTAHGAQSEGEGGILIDTPGVRSFETYHLSEADIKQGFVEISPHLGRCKFSDCSHTRETGCAVIDALDDGKISQLRYDSFLQIFSENQQYERRNTKE